MPNMVGGSQHHPAYDPRSELAPNEVLVGNDLYTLEVKFGNVLDRVSVECVDGHRWKTLVSESPEEVQRRAIEINAVGALRGLSIFRLLSSPFPADELVHRSIIPFRAICGADEKNQATSQVASHVTCERCRSLQEEP